MKVFLAGLFLFTCVYVGIAFAGPLPGMVSSDYKSYVVYDQKSHNLLRQAYKGMVVLAQRGIEIDVRERKTELTTTWGSALKIIYPKGLEPGTCGAETILIARDDRVGRAFGLSMRWDGHPWAFYERFGELFVAAEPSYPGRYLDVDLDSDPGEYFLGRIGARGSYISFASTGQTFPGYKETVLSGKSGFVVLGGEFKGMSGRDLRKYLHRNYESCGGPQRGRLVDYLAYVLLREAGVELAKPSQVAQVAAGVVAIPSVIDLINLSAFSGCKE